MSNYEILAQAIRSGQCSTAQIVEHMRDRVFAAYYAKHFALHPAR